MVQIGAWKLKWYDKMKYIITESQYKTIVESNKRVETFQELINKEFKEIQDICNDDDDSYNMCYSIDTIEYITVTDVESIPSEYNPKIILKINIMYNFMRYKDYSDFIYEFQYMIRKSTGLPIDIQYEVVNLNTDPQW
jgi:hypothetical protein